MYQSVQMVVETAHLSVEVVVGPEGVGTDVLSSTGVTVMAACLTCTSSSGGSWPISWCCVNKPCKHTSQVGTFVYTSVLFSTVLYILVHICTFPNNCVPFCMARQGVDNSHQILLHMFSQHHNMNIMIVRPNTRDQLVSPSKKGNPTRASRKSASST